MMVQNYAGYTAEDNEIWSVLYERQVHIIENVAYKGFTRSLKLLGMHSASIPDFHSVNEKLVALTGWKIYAVPGLIDNRDFFQGMQQRRFGATTWLRTRQQLDYLEEPDMFHDTFGHVPLLADPEVADYLLALAETTSPYLDRNDIIEQVARLYWYTIEFGLVREEGEIKIFGAGILSSPGETSYALSKEARKVPFDLQTVLQTPYCKDSFQPHYFVLDSTRQLTEIIPQLQQYLAHQ
ncbi:MAG: phenylalanine 4-monooxygenase [Ginsengibacter sp.]